MNPEVGCYYRSSSPWKCLDNKLTPIFQKLQTNNICSIFELKEEKKDEGTTLGAPERKTISTFKVANSDKFKNTYPRGRYTQLRNRDKVKKIDVSSLEQQLHNDKIMLVSSKSKIKKHLVDTIDYQGIQNSLYHKKPRVTRFEHFYSTLVNKGEWQSRTNRSIDLGKSRDRQENVLHYATLNDVRRPFRIKSKRLEPADHRIQVTSHRYSSLRGY